MRYIRLIKKRMYHRPMLGRVRWASMMRFPFYPAGRWLSGFIRANVNGRFAVPILRQCQEPFNPVFRTNADNCASNAPSIGSSVVELSNGDFRGILLMVIWARCFLDPR